MNLNNPKIRRLEWDDFAELAEQELAYHMELERNPHFGIGTYGSKPEPTGLVDWFTKLYTAALCGDAFVSVAEVGGKIVGMCHIEAGHFAEGPHVGELGISVVKKHRNAGIGARLIKAALEDSRGRFEIISSSVFSTNKSAIALYKRFGFKEYSVAPKFVKRGHVYISSVSMYLDIGRGIPRIKKDND
jgi:RimJ/RimL family protein N-acetyltransferase